MSIRVALNWASTKEQHKFFNLESLYEKIFNVEEKENAHPHCLEVVTSNLRRCFFDVDEKDPNAGDPLMNVKKLIAHHFYIHFQIELEEEDFTICSASTDENGKTLKHSYHITLPFVCTAEENQRIAEALHQSYRGVDTGVYHSFQPIRLLHCTKPHYKDPAQRRKVPHQQPLSLEFFKSTLVSYTEGLDVLVNPLPVQAYTPPVLALPSYGRLRWFYTLLQESRLAEIWRKKADSYELWMNVGFSLYHEGEESLLLPQAEELFVYFSSFSPGHLAELGKVRQKFQRECKKHRSQYWNLIRAWLKGSKATRELIEPHESVYQANGPSAPCIVASTGTKHSRDTTFTDFSVIPYNIGQYRFMEHFKHEEVRAMWSEQITNWKDIAKILPVLRYCSSQEDDCKRTYELRMKKKAAAYGDIIFPYPAPNSEESTIMLDVLEALEISCDEKLLATLFEGPEPDQASLVKAWEVYAETVKPLLGEEAAVIEVYIENHSFFPVLPRETVDPWARILKCLEYIEEGIAWTTQVPYLSLWQRVRKTFEEVGPHANKQVVFTAFADLFVADTIFHFFCSAHSDTAAASIVYSLYPFWIWTEASTFYVYDEINGLWTQDEQVMLRIITKYASFLEKTAGLGGNYGNTSGSKNHVLKELHSLEAIRRSTYHLSTLQQSAYRKILYPNGYYDGEKGLFYPAHRITVEPGKNHRVFAHPEIMFLCQVADDYFELRPDDLIEMQAMRDILFIVQHGEEVGQYHLEQLAAALFGEKRKAFHIHIGAPNTGKSSEIALAAAALHTTVGEFNADEFKFVEGDRRESTLENSIAYDNWWRRILFCSESTENKINNEKLKLHCSGGEDKVRTRTQYKAPILVNIHYTMFFYVNNMWKWMNPSDPATAARANFYDWNKTFVDEVTDPSCQIQKRPEIEKWKTIAYRRQLFVHILLGAYAKLRENNFIPLPKPASVTQASAIAMEEVTTTTEVFQQLMYLLEFDGNEDSYITSNQLKEICQARHWSHISTSKKITEVMNSLKVGPNKSIAHAKKRILGITTNVIKGVSARANLVDPESGHYLTDFTQWKKLMEEHDTRIPDQVLQELRTVAKLMNVRRGFSAEEKYLIETYATEEQKAHVVKHNRFANLD